MVHTSVVLFVSEV